MIKIFSEIVKFSAALGYNLTSGQNIILKDILESEKEIISINPKYKDIKGKTHLLLVYSIYNLINNDEWINTIYVSTSTSETKNHINQCINLMFAKNEIDKKLDILNVDLSNSKNVISIGNKILTFIPLGNRTNYTRGNVCNQVLDLRFDSIY